MDLGAPGYDIYSTLPTIQTRAMSSDGLTANYGTLSGTSMAAPHVAGALALLRASQPSLSCKELKERLLNSTDHILSLEGKCLTEGRLNLDRAVHNRTTPITMAAIDRPFEESATTTEIMLSSKEMEISGTADSIDFNRYTIDVGEGRSPTLWTTNGVVLVNGGRKPVVEGKLADWHCATTVVGTWTLRLTVHSSWGSKTILRRVAIDPLLKPGFPAYTGFTFGSYSFGPNIICVVVADINGDGNKEVIGSGMSAGPLYAWDCRGRVVPGWPTERTGMAYPAALDMDGDGKAEVASSFCEDVNDGKWGIFDGHGKYLPGWPQPISNYGSSPPVIADLDGDGTSEVLVDQEDGRIWAYRLNGTPMPGWPQTAAGQWVIPIVVGDVNNDGRNEVFAMTGGVIVHGFKHDGSILPGWPKSMVAGPYGSHHTNGLALGDVDGDGNIEIVIAYDDSPGYDQGGGKVRVYAADGTPKPGWPMALSTISHPSYTHPPALADLDGDGIPEIVVATSGYVYALRGNGTVLPGWPQSTRVSWMGNFSPVVGDIDGDGEVDVLMGIIPRAGKNHTDS